VQLLAPPTFLFYDVAGCYFLQWLAINVSVCENFSGGLNRLENITISQHKLRKLCHSATLLNLCEVLTASH